jgi:hypothetical protein
LKPKYRVISNLLGETFDPIGGLDVFIDLNTFLHNLSTSSKYMSSLVINDNAEKDLITTMLMTYKHWKDYTRKFNDVRIFMIINDMDMQLMDETSTLKSYLVPMVNKYRQDRFSKLKEYWNSALQKVSVIMKYIPNSYIINCNRFDSLVFPELISGDREKIIVTASSMMTNYTYIPKSYVLYSRFSNEGISSINDPIMIVQSISKIDDPIMSTFCQNRVFYNLLNAIIGDFERGIIGLSQMGITTFATDLLRAVEKHEIPNNPMNVESVINVIKPQFQPYVKQSYPLIDITTHASMIKQSNVEKIKATMIDQIDIDGLQSLTIDGLNLLELV